MFAKQRFKLEEKHGILQTPEQNRDQCKSRITVCDISDIEQMCKCQNFETNSGICGGMMGAAVTAAAKKVFTSYLCIQIG